MSLEKKHIVVMGGGNGSSVVISSLKDNFNLSAIVSMADDGGSTGRLRKELGTSAVGDIRQCLVAFADSEYAKDLFSYRFSDGELEGHSFGNLFLTTIEKSTGSLYKAIAQAKNILEIKNGDVIPVTDDNPELVMDYGGGTVRGVYQIANTNIEGKKAEFRLEPSTAKLSKKAEEAIGKADLIIVAPGNFYCSVLPALIVGGVVDCISKSRAQKIFISNLVNFDNHTKGFNAKDYLAEACRVLKANNRFIDILVANDNEQIEGNEKLVLADDSAFLDTEIIKADLVSHTKIKPNPNDKISRLRSKVMHDEKTLNKIITQILRS